MTAKYPTVLWAGVIGILATIFVGGGEFLLHLYNIRDNDTPTYDFLLSLDKEHLILGHFLTTLASPLYLAGYWHVYQMLNPKKNSIAGTFCIIVGYGCIIGNTWTGTHLMMALIAQTQNSLPAIHLLITINENYYDFFLQITRLTTLLFSLSFMILVSFRLTFYPRWFILFSPIFLLLCIFILSFSFPSISILMTPMAMTIAHLIFFTGSVLILITKKSGISREKT